MHDLIVSGTELFCCDDREDLSKNILKNFLISSSLVVLFIYRINFKNLSNHSIHLDQILDHLESDVIEKKLSYFINLLLHFPVRNDIHRIPLKEYRSINKIILVLRIKVRLKKF